MTGDIIPIQIIDSRELSEGENLWLRNLDNRLNVEGIRMSDVTLEQVLERTGLLAKWESKWEAKYKAEGKREVAKELINIGLPLEQIAQVTGLDIETLTQ